MQVIPYNLKTVPVVIGGRDTILLNQIPKTLYGRVVHLAGILFYSTITPTLSSGSATVVGLNNLVKTCNVFDGSNYRFKGGFNTLRAMDWLTTGKMRLPDPDACPTTETRYFQRVWTPGPANFAGGMDHGGSDFVIPAGALESGQIDIQFGAITDIKSDCTTYTGTLQPVALLALLDEIRVPPLFQVDTQDFASKDGTIQGNALYSHLALLNDAAFGAISAGDFGNLTVNPGQGSLIEAVAARTLTALFQAQLAGGSVTALDGEPVAADDDNAKSVNASTPTALVGASQIVQPILYAPKRAKLSKLVRAESSLRLRWDGSQSTGVALFGRVLDQPPTAAAALANRALRSLDKKMASIKVKTVSKRPYTGPFSDFMPFKIDTVK